MGCEFLQHIANHQFSRAVCLHKQCVNFLNNPCIYVPNMRARAQRRCWRGWASRTRRAARAALSTRCRAAATTPARPTRTPSSATGATLTAPPSSSPSATSAPARRWAFRVSSMVVFFLGHPAGQASDFAGLMCPPSHAKLQRVCSVFAELGCSAATPRQAWHPRWRGGELGSASGVLPGLPVRLCRCFDA